jgi:hypothetical protein
MKFPTLSKGCVWRAAWRVQRHATVGCIPLRDKNG